MYNIYEFIKSIISKHEPDSDDEFEVLDKIFGIFNPNPWETKFGDFVIRIQSNEALGDGFCRRFSIFSPLFFFILN